MHPKSRIDTHNISIGLLCTGTRRKRHNSELCKYRNSTNHRCQILRASVRHTRTLDIYSTQITIIEIICPRIINVSYVMHSCQLIVCVYVHNNVIQF